MLLEIHVAPASASNVEVAHMFNEPLVGKHLLCLLKVTVIRSGTLFQDLPLEPAVPAAWMMIWRVA